MPAAVPDGASLPYGRALGDVDSEEDVADELECGGASRAAQPGAPYGCDIADAADMLRTSGSRRSSNDASCSSRMDRRHAGDASARMRVAGARYAALCTIVCCTGHAAVAAADTVPVQVPYTAPPECPDASAFAAELAKRVAAPHGGSIDGADDPRRLSVHIEKRDGGFEGQLTVAQEGSVGTRQVRSADCATVVRSLAVFVALALAERPDSAPQTSVPKEEDEAPRTSPPTPATARQLDRPRSTPRAESTRPAVAQARRAKPAAPSVWQFDSGIQAQYSRAGADAFGARVSAEWSRHFASTPIVPALRLSWGFSDFDRPLVDGGELHYRLRTARAEVCGGTVWWRTHNSLCGAFEVGQLAVASSGLPRSGRAESSWSAGGLIARTRLTILDPVGVELALGLFTPFQRPEFTLVDPVRQAHRVPPVMLDAQLGIAVSTRWR